MDNAKFIEGVEYGGSTGLRNFVFEEEYVIISTIATENDQEEQQHPQLEVSLRRSTREKRMTIPNDCIVYLQEHEFDMGLEDDPISFS
ncbi:hypothetical protein CK203_117172 [Vitis vinifera]|uniref:Uncharacterized protein n=1 Tax=Vitis vinifera TaxID=29760 RepID=A0A438EMI1_VITVI|nr:hypothetical protein CK203_117172 [Vitis vinifera]